MLGSVVPMGIGVSSKGLRGVQDESNRGDQRTQEQERAQPPFFVMYACFPEAYTYHLYYNIISG